MFVLSPLSNIKEGVESYNSLKAHKFLIRGVCLRKIPLGKIVESLWKEGIVGLEVVKSINMF